MSTLTIRVPDDKRERLKALARSHSISNKKLMDELAKVALPNHDARVRFATRAASVVFDSWWNLNQLPTSNALLWFELERAIASCPGD